MSSATILLGAIQYSILQMTEYMNCHQQNIINNSNMEAAPIPIQQISRQMPQPLSKILFHQTIIHQIFLCSMISDSSIEKLNLELVYQMAKLNIQRKQFGITYRKQLLEWRNNMDFMKKEYIKAEYCKFFKNPQVFFNSEIHQFVRKSSKGGDRICHQAHATKQFLRIVEQIRKQSAMLEEGKQRALTSEQKADEDGTWSFRQLKGLFSAVMLQRIFFFMVWPQAALLIPLKNQQQIKQKVYRHFFKDAQMRLQQPEQKAEKGLMPKIVQQLKKYLYQCYYQRGLGLEEMVDDFYLVMKASKRTQDDQIKLTMVCASFIGFAFTEQQCKTSQFNSQQNHEDAGAMKRLPLKQDRKEQIKN